MDAHRAMYQASRTTGARSGLVPLPVGILLPKFGLKKFPHRSARNFVGEDERIRHLPLQEFCREKFAQFLRLHWHSVFPDYDSEGPFLPFRVRNSDDSRFAHSGMAHRRVLEIHRTGPFSARFDHVFASIDEFHIAFRIDGSDVAASEPPVWESSDRASRALRSSSRPPRVRGL